MPRTGLRGLLGSPAYRRLWLARTTSAVGDVAQFTTLALLLALLADAVGIRAVYLLGGVLLLAAAAVGLTTARARDAPAA